MQMVKAVLQVVAARAKEMQVIVMKIVEDAPLAVQTLKMALVFALMLIPLQTSTLLTMSLIAVVLGELVHQLGLVVMTALTGSLLQCLPAAGT